MATWDKAMTKLTDTTITKKNSLVSQKTLSLVQEQKVSLTNWMLTYSYGENSTHFQQVHGEVVQTIVILTRSLRGQRVKHMLTV